MFLNVDASLHETQRVLLLKLGRRDAAIQRYKALERELGIEPLPETTPLLRQ